MWKAEKSKIDRIVVFDHFVNTVFNAHLKENRKRWQNKYGHFQPGKTVQYRG
jgi:hypothetical protein